MIDSSLVFCLKLSNSTPVETGSLLTDENRGLLFAKEVIHSGTFFKEGEEFTITDEEIEHWKKTVDMQLSHGVRIDVPSEHANGEFAPDRSRGKVVGAEVHTREDGTKGLTAYIEFGNEKQAELAKTAESSIFVPPSYEIGTTGQVLHRPLREVALTQNPVVPGLGQFDLILSHGPTDMKIADLAKSLGVTFDDGADESTIAGAIKKAWKAKGAPPKKKEDETKLSNEPPSDDGNVTPFNLNLLRKSRMGDLNALELGKHITPAQKKKLESTFCSDDALTLSLTNEAVLNQFDEYVETAKLNTIDLGDGSDGSQHQTLELSKEDINDPKKNPLSAACADA